MQLEREVDVDYEEKIYVSSLCEKYNIDFPEQGLIGLAFYLWVNNYEEERAKINIIIDNLIYQTFME